MRRLNMLSKRDTDHLGVDSSLLEPAGLAPKVNAALRMGVVVIDQVDLARGWIDGCSNHGDWQEMAVW